MKNRKFSAVTNAALIALPLTVVLPGAAYSQIRPVQEKRSTIKKLLPLIAAGQIAAIYEQKDENGAPQPQNLYDYTALEQSAEALSNAMVSAANAYAAATDPDQIEGQFPPPPPPPATVYGLGGDSITLLQQDNVNYPATAIVTPNVEYQNFETFPLSATALPPRWNIDVQADSIRIDFIHPNGLASYGPGFEFNFKDLNPQIPGCTGIPVIINGITTTNRTDVPYTEFGTSFAAWEVDIPLGPPKSEPETTYDWAVGDWIETKLVFACSPPPTPSQMQVKASEPERRGAAPARPQRKTIPVPKRHQ